MNKNVKRIFALMVAIAVIGLLATVKMLSDNVDIVPSNSPDTIGNTAGNLYNGGLFAEEDGIIYFSNPYDSRKLYSYDTSSGLCKKLAAGSASFINAAGGYIYYYSDSASSHAGLGYVRKGRGIYRLKTSKNENIMLADTTTDGMILTGDTLVYTAFTEGAKDDGNADVGLYGLDTNGGDPALLLKGHPGVGSVNNGLLYYSCMQESGHLNSLNPLTGASTEISSLRMFLPDSDGSKIYFLDADDDYHLKAFSVADGSVSVIAAERCDTFNRYGNIIYYQTAGRNSSDYALKRIFTDGTGMETVRNGVHKNISIAAGYVFFRDFQSDVPVYMTPLSGSVNVSTFDIAALSVVAD